MVLLRLESAPGSGAGSPLAVAGIRCEVSCARNDHTRSAAIPAVPTANLSAALLDPSIFPPRGPARQTRDFHILNAILALQIAYVQCSQFSVWHPSIDGSPPSWHHSSRSIGQPLPEDSNEANHQTGKQPGAGSAGPRTANAHACGS